ncbi:MAG: hypothetical protein IJD17_05420 [Clostridia bacterium]|nr:hypothetical protein [Clostridia bacterium]
MNNMLTLYGYELKKLMQKKLIWVTLLVCMAAIAFSILFPLLGSYSVNGVSMGTNYEQHLIDQAYRKALSGKPIDQSLLEETVDAYKDLPIETDYVLTEEYRTYARPYSEIFNLIRLWTAMDKQAIAQWDPDEVALYAAMMDRFEEAAVNNRLTEAEIEYWQGQADTIATPVVYRAHEAYRIILETFLTVGFMMLLYVAIALSGSFPDEHTHRTDQLVMCTANGKRRLYWVKLFSGITVGCAGALLMTALTWGLCLYVYGSEGFDAAMQIFYTNYAGNITVGQACLIAYGCLLVTAFLIGVFVMFLSELFHGSIAAISITTGMILAGMLVQIPPEYRILGQIWDYMPTGFLAMWNTFDLRLVSLFGRHFTSYQIVPLIYVVAAALPAWLGSRIYCRRQISGR